MKISTRANSIRALGLGAIAMFATVGYTCRWGSSGGPSTIQDCQSYKDSANFPTSGTVDLVKPAYCPFVLNDTATIPFAATGSMPANATTYEYYNAWVKDRLGRMTSWTTSTSWSGRGTPTYVVQISGSYFAGHGGWDGQSKGFDQWYHQFLTSYGYVAAHTNLAYQKGKAGAAVAGPTTGIASGTRYDLLATTNDPFMTGPITWSWYVDGSLVGTTSDGAFSWTAGGPGTTQEIDAVITDAGGLTHTGITFVTVCPGTEITC